MPEGERFSDPDFSADKELLLETAAHKCCVDWKRPCELRKRPQMFVDGASRCDVLQGGIGDCWFLAACVGVAQQPDLIKRIIPEGQVLYGKDYTGSVRFRFWRMGEWETVCIDDRLPVNAEGQLVGAQCKDPDEFWVPLLEKAFAKFHGNYNNLHSGQKVEGLISLTGYIVENFKISEMRKEDFLTMFNMFQKETRRKSILTCSRSANYDKGLSGDHTYTITGSMVLRSPEEVRLIRLRNPWGEGEWTGDWNDNDKRWDKIDEKTKKVMEFKRSDDGEFWMELFQFFENFDDVTIAMKIPVICDNNDFQCLQMFHSCWQKGLNAGGSIANPEKFASNPQYLLTITDADASCEEEVDDEGNEFAGYNVVIELIQEHDRSKRRHLDPIALSVYPAVRGAHRLTASDFLSVPEEEGSSPKHVRTSAAVARLDLGPGSYIAVPSTYEPDTERRFMLRVYSRGNVLVRCCLR